MRKRRSLVSGPVLARFGCGLGSGFKKDGVALGWVYGGTLIHPHQQVIPGPQSNALCGQPAPLKIRAIRL